MAEKKEKDPSPAPKYPLDELLSYSETIFNCKPEVIRGAIAGTKQQEFTIDEMKKLIGSFTNRRVIT
jgi:hypothetical protein